MRREFSKIRLIVMGLAVAACVVAPVASAPAAGSAGAELPPIRHVWVIMLENRSFNPALNFKSPFNSPGLSPYLADHLRHQGNLLTQYWGTGHLSQDNYVAIVSGQSPTPGTQSDGILCAGNFDPGIPDTAPVDPHGQIVGQGCHYPTKVKTLADQLDAETDEDLTWKGYMQDIRDDLAHDSPFCPNQNNGGLSNGTSQYANKHDPWQWFSSITDDQPRCLGQDVPLTELATDLQSIATTPNFSFIAPGLSDDGHDGDWTANPDVWLRQYVPMIMDSPAYRQDGMIVINFDESNTVLGVPAGSEDDQACCNEIPGPNSPLPGEVGPGGGRTGALVLSPFIKPDTIDDPPANPTNTGQGYYNHYSFLRSMEDLFDIDADFPEVDDDSGHLGFAGTYVDYPGPGSFGSDVYNGFDPDRDPTAPVAPEPPHGPTGPRAADGSTTWQNPLPQGGDLNGIDCVTTTGTCVAVGDGGALVTSSDGGENWSARGSSTQSDLNGIDCATGSSCVAVGDGGAVTTGDGGATWSSQAPPVGVPLNAVSCSSATSCVAVGDDGAVVTSADGGQSWTPRGSGASEPLYGVSCPSETVCYAAGRSGTILKSQDGGASWASLATGDSERLWSIDCPNVSTCVAAGDDIRQVGDGILRTENGGATWSQQRSVAQAPVWKGVSCASASTCLLAGEQEGIASKPEVAAVQATVNGGADWNLQKPHSTNLLHAVSCASTTACVAVGVRGSIRLTTDAGASWSNRSPGTAGALSRVLCAAPEELSCMTEAINALRGVSFPDPSTGFAVGSFRTVMATDDGGGAWETQTTQAFDFDKNVEHPPVPEPDLNGISCASSSACVAVGDAGSVVTTGDGGANWSDQDPDTQNDLLGVSCPSNTTCFAVGSRGAIVKSNDGGASWHDLNSHVNTLLSGISCADSANCVAVGAFGTILTTDDQGAIWNPADPGTSAYLDGVTCDGSGLCLAVGEGGLVLRSTDGGQTWSESDSGVGDELMSVSCADASSCVASGSAGTVISSSDGGSSWTTQGTGTSRAFRAASATTENQAFVVGDAAAIQRVCPAGGSCLSIDDVSVTEGDSGTTDASFTVTLSSPSDQTVTVDYQTSDGTAKAPDDYEAQSGTLTFAPGETSKTIAVPVKGDTIGEGDEDFTVDLSNAQNAAIDDGSGTGTIVDDDATLSIDDQTVVEGDTGTTDATFTVTLRNAAPGDTVTVDYQTNDGTATAPGDYEAQSGTLSFAPGESSKTITVPVKGDLLSEGDEAFTVDLSNAQNAALIKDRGTGTILDDDPKISIDDVTVDPEGDSGTSNANFTVSLSNQSDNPVQVDYATADATAKAPDDYEPTSGTLTFDPGQTEKTVPVPVKGDTVDEPEQTFKVDLSDPQGGAIGDGHATGTIEDDDDPPSTVFEDVSVDEGDSGANFAYFTVSLAGKSEKLIKIDYATADGSAHAPGDYSARTGTLVFDPSEAEEHEESERVFAIPIKPNTVDGPDRTFSVDLSNPENVTLGDDHATGTIRDDDDVPAIAIDDQSVIEPESGPINALASAVFHLTLSSASANPVSVDYQTADGTAAAPGDYEAQGGTVSFEPGQTSQTVEIPIHGDSVDEPPEQFGVELSQPVNASLGDASGLGTILNWIPDQSAPCSYEIVGTDGDDSLTGTDAGDRIQGLEGADTLSGVAGDDCVEGNAGKDSVSGGPGHDSVLGDAGNDDLSGGGGKDVINGGPGRDLVDGGAGGDEIHGGPGRDRFDGGDGDDTIRALGSTDRVDCGPGEDTAYVDPRDGVKGCEHIKS